MDTIQLTLVRTAIAVRPQFPHSHRSHIASAGRASPFDAR